MTVDSVINHPELASRECSYAILTFQFHKEGQLWVGTCQELGTATDGRSLQRVEAELAELVNLHLDALEDAGERERFFAEYGISLYERELPETIERTVQLSSNNPLIQFRVVPVAATRSKSVGSGR